MTTPAADVIVLYAPTYRIDNRHREDKGCHPYKLHAIFQPPQLMGVTFVLIYGSEEYILRGTTREVLEAAVDKNGWRNHSRLRRIVLTHPDGTEEQIAGQP